MTEKTTITREIPAVISGVIVTAGFGEIDFPMGGVDDYTLEGMLWHAIKQLLGESAAGKRKDGTEKGIDEIRARMKALVESTHRFGGGGGSPRTQYEVELHDLVIARARAVANWNKTKAIAQIKEHGLEGVIGTLVRRRMIAAKLDHKDKALAKVVYDREFTTLSDKAQELADEKAASVAMVAIDDAELTAILAEAKAAKAAKA